MPSCICPDCLSGRRVGFSTVTPCSTCAGQGMIEYATGFSEPDLETFREMVENGFGLIRISSVLKKPTALVTSKLRELGLELMEDRLRRDTSPIRLRPIGRPAPEDPRSYDPRPEKPKFATETIISEEESAE